MKKSNFFRFCAEYELPKQARTLIRELLLNFDSLEENEVKVFLSLSEELHDVQLGLCILYLKCMHFDYQICTC